MVIINEWLPNPKGDDATGEWVELMNNGGTPVSLSGWSLKASKGKSFTLSARDIPAGGFVVVPRSESGITLRNTDESVFLRDEQGNLVDQSSFRGVAQDGKSFARVGSHFSFIEPTPGAANPEAPSAGAMQSAIVYNKAFNAPPGAWTVVGLTVVCALALSLAVVYLTKKNHDLSELFFGAD